MRYRVNVRPIADLRRTADVVFTKQRLAVFVDGCFWHRCPNHGTIPRSNTDWWIQKLQKTVDRDRATSAALEAAGWTPLRCWEHDDPTLVADRIEKLVLADR